MALDVIDAFVLIHLWSHRIGCVWINRSTCLYQILKMMLDYKNAWVCVFPTLRWCLLREFISIHTAY